MPMPALIASGAIFSINGSGISASAPTRLMTTTYLTEAGNNRRREAGLYGLYWSYVTVSAATGAASATIPCITWYDPNILAPITATAGAYGNLVNGGVATSVYGASAIGAYGLSAAVSSRLCGCEYFYCGSGASGASAYIQVSSVASNPSANSTVYRFDFRLFQVDSWGV